MAFDEGFLARWSRRKAESHLPSGSADPISPCDPAPYINSAQRSSGEPATDLDCTSLEFSSDFSRFVCDGISNAVQTAALRRLWVTSPLFGASDGLDVYRADYAHASPLGHVPDIASRALQMVAAEQCVAERSTPRNEAPSDRSKQSPDPPAQEPQPND